MLLLMRAFTEFDNNVRLWRKNSSWQQKISQKRNEKLWQKKIKKKQIFLVGLEKLEIQIYCVQIPTTIS